ncbi:hypothetical protein LguiB_011576 [Lonicera macranthoides]
MDNYLSSTGLGSASMEKSNGASNNASWSGVFLVTINGSSRFKNCTVSSRVIAWELCQRATVEKSHDD